MNLLMSISFFLKIVLWLLWVFKICISFGRPNAVDYTVDSLLIAHLPGIDYHSHDSEKHWELPFPQITKIRSSLVSIEFTLIPSCLENYNITDEEIVQLLKGRRRGKN